MHRTRLGVVRFTNIVLAALVVGTMFGIWLGYDPARLTASAYVEQQQNAIRAEADETYRNNGETENDDVGGRLAGGDDHRRGRGEHAAKQEELPRLQPRLCHVRLLRRRASRGQAFSVSRRQPLSVSRR